MPKTSSFLLGWVVLTLACSTQPEEPSGQQQLGVESEPPRPPAQERELSALRAQKVIAAVVGESMERERHELDLGDGAEEVDLLVADVRVIQALRGKTEEKLRVQQVDSFHAVNLEPKAEALLGLEERADGTFWIRTSSSIRDGVVTDLGETLEATVKLLEESK
ncbi:MAG TPA: hypothetical protein VM686_23870 [Polyangiaceae bacterium]|nr:hypothetical protein [Polyangiaceae bacterium]